MILFRKGMKRTLESFRSEWSRPGEEVRYSSLLLSFVLLTLLLSLRAQDSLMMSWQQICLKLRMENTESKGHTLIESIVQTLIDDVAVRTRQKPSVLVDGLATLPRLKSTAAPAGSVDETAEQMQLILTRTSASKVSIPPQSQNRKTDIPKGSTKGAKRLLKKIHEDIMIDTYGRPKISNENWIPETIRFKSIERDIAVAKANLMDSMVVEAEKEKEMKRLSQNELHRAQVEESLGSKKKINCGCCNFLYSHINLTLKVSIKAVTDLRKKWINGKPNGYADPDGAKVGNVPRCYNEVGVCRFCAQFFRDQTTYRPSFDEIAYEERKAIFFETRRLEKEYWDPLKMCAKDEERRRRENNDLLAAESTDHVSCGGDDQSWGSGSESMSPR